METIENNINKKRVTITSKRQFTIPNKFFISLGFDKEATCTMKEGCLIIEPVKKENDAYFSEQILEELINEGYSGKKLLAEFKIRQAKIRPAVENMIHEAKNVAHGKGKYSTLEEVFPDEKKK